MTLNLGTLKLVIFSHKPSWKSGNSPSGYATDGGFPFQVRSIAEIFSESRVMVPCGAAKREGEIALGGGNLVVVPLTPLRGSGLVRKIKFPIWLLRNLPWMVLEVLRADAVHSPIPGDVGTIGMFLAFIFRKPLFVRHCGNWDVQKTSAERFWKWFMERFAGDRNVMLTTGGDVKPPSKVNPAISWIFSSSLTESQLAEYRQPRTLGNPSNARMIIVCRQEEKKGTGIVLESLLHLHPEIPGLHLDVVGDGSALEKLKAQAFNAGLTHNVTFYGKLDHEGVIARLKAADLFCYPTSASEGFPKVVLEALACGLPVITTRVSVLPTLIGGGGGVLLNEANPLELSAAIRIVLNDPRRYEEMSRRALKIAQEYSLERWRNEIAAHLQRGWGRVLNGSVVAQN
jgi:glycosyltransferase involved in cell wall biosynthesis